MAQYTLSHFEKSLGWTSFWSYIPDCFGRLNNRFYSIKNGQLWLHNDQANPTVNNFYGNQYGTRVKTVFNDAPAEDKAYKTIMQESQQPWETNLVTNLTNSTIKSTEFNTRESRQYSFIRQNENSSDLHGGVAQGIGTISSVNGLSINFQRGPELVNIGDTLKQINGANQVIIGVISNVNDNVITVGAIVNAPVQGLFAFAQKPARAEGSDVRGYFLQAELINNDTTQAEIFAVSAEAVKSHV